MGQNNGAMPGPACYGRGGTEPTVTDASLVLGYLNQATFAGGLDIDVENSRRAIESRVAEPLGMSVVEAALGIHAIVNSNMAQTLRLVSIKRGHDPRDFVLIPFGGAGPLQGGRLAEQASIRKILIPPTPGVLSAMGLMLAPLQHEALISFEVPTAEADVSRIHQLFEPLDADCRRKMLRDGVGEGEVTTTYFAEMRYVGQAHQLEIEIGQALPDGLIPRLESAFHTAHERAYSHSDPEAPTEFVALRTVHRRPPAERDLLAGGYRGGAPEPLIGSRDICLTASEGFRSVPVYARQALPNGFEIRGPAIVEQADTTTLIYEDHVALVDDFGNLIVEVPNGQG